MAKAANLKTAEIEKINHLDYFNIAVSVDCVIFGYEKKELKVLLIKSDLEEFRKLWSLLGDFVRPDEEELACVTDELVARIAGAEERDQRRAEVRSPRIVEVDQVEAVSFFGARLGRDHQIMAVLAHHGVQHPLRVIRGFEDELVG